MRTFNVYKHPTLGIEAVKVGASYPAFFFGIFWILAKKLWIWAGIWLAVIIALYPFELLIAKRSGEDTADIAVRCVLLVLWIVVTYKGNKWREDNLSKRGYEKLTTVQAETPDAAVAQALNLSAQPRQEALP